MNVIRREMPFTVKIVGEKEGLVEYRASDETLDSYREVVLASGWRFDRFQKNAPFVNSHNYDSIENLLGSVRAAEVREGALMETVQWAIDVKENRLAQLGWKMTTSGHLKAVSVGFIPTETLQPEDKAYAGEVERLGLKDNPPRVIYTGQQQIELSACIIGANPNALASFARAYKGGVLDDADLQLISERLSSKTLSTGREQHASSSVSSGADEEARRRMQLDFALKIKLIAMNL